MIGTTMLNEETMHMRVGNMKGHSHGSYTRHGNSIMDLDPPWGIKYVVAAEFPRWIGQ